ncbi:MAG TPA: TetR/AcrR family transcriptional regulator [Polyangiaceae bacterium]|nr:TetR/AcrR family transcriptional regulator [Polyangiaceae bacterium]
MSSQARVARAKNSSPAAALAITAGKVRMRDRIFETACELFYQHGIRAVGVDAITAGAGTNKTTFYRSFASKEALVAEYLREQVRQYFKVWDEAVGQFPKQPKKQVEALFERFLRPNDGPRCQYERGCALGNAAVEIAEEDAELERIIAEYKAEIRARFRKLARDAGARDPGVLGDTLMLLMEGGAATRLTFSDRTGPAASIVKAVRALMAAHAA